MSAMSILPIPSPTGTLLPATHQPRVVSFLQTHFEQGMLEPHSYDMLYRTLRMMDEIALVLFPPSHILHVGIRQRVEALADAITDIFYVFGEHIDRALRRAKRANEELPDLDVAEEQRYENLKVWREAIETLHWPSTNDVKLYRLFLIYYDDEVYAPFLQLHREEPEHGSWQLQHRLTRIRDCIVSLYEDCEEANQIVKALDDELRVGMYRSNVELSSVEGSEAGRVLSPMEQAAIARRLSPIEEAETVTQSSSVVESNGRNSNVIRSRTTNDLLESLDDFFEDSQDMTQEEGEQRLLSNNDYNIEPRSSNALEEPLVPESDSEVPRVFTGSFSQLEDSVRGLRLHRVEFSLNGDDEDDEGAIKIKDFAPRTPSLLPSPATLLERRDALSTREPAWERRMIGGQVVQSRRPHDHSRAQTVDERGAGLDAWLAEPPSPFRATTRAGGARSKVLHKQHTL